MKKVRVIDIEERLKNFEEKYDLSCNMSTEEFILSTRKKDIDMDGRSQSSHILLENNGHILLVKNKYTGLFGLPGGTREDEESEEQCAQRELKEECGIVIDLSGSKKVDVEEFVRYTDFDRDLSKVRTFFYK